ncbi:hypothetical protein ACIGZJ_36065 [Kitasatospora sp. NPDC052868]|uniref:hypothetical protein n=1 Tax=Kitasatospora sp. NPDC052868 TaxID=3364060 RepID=UPI0037C8CC8B
MSDDDQPFKWQPWDDIELPPVAPATEQDLDDTGRLSREYDPGLADEGLSYEDVTPPEEIERRERLEHEQAYQDLDWGYEEGLFTEEEYRAELEKLDAWGAEHGYDSPQESPPAIDSPAAEPESWDVAPPAPEAAAVPTGMTADQLDVAMGAARDAAATLQPPAAEIAAPLPAIEGPTLGLGIEPPF